MDKKKRHSLDPLRAEQKPAETDPQPKAEQKPQPENRRVTRYLVKLRRDGQVGDQQRKAGDVIGAIECETGVHLNFVVDAVRCGIASTTLVES